MNRVLTAAETDGCTSLAASEFVWQSAGCSEVHGDVRGPILKLLHKSAVQTVLDLGCGNGAFTAELSKAGLQATGSDCSTTGLSLARAHYSSIPFFHHDLSEPLGESHTASYDAVTAVEVIEHLLLPRLLLRSALAALKPGGLLIVTTPFHGYWKNLALALTGSFDNHWHPLRDYGHVKFFSKNTLSALFHEQGLEMAFFQGVGRIPVLAKSMIIAGRKPR
jgi:2-polyprenyl-3-methyl-5-hydroxy-6-metoxy-1,4-benzoquinol methylase